MQTSSASTQEKPAAQKRNFHDLYDDGGSFERLLAQKFKGGDLSEIESKLHQDASSSRNGGFNQIRRYLVSIGLRRMEPLGRSGSFNMLMRAPNNQVVRISLHDSPHHDRPYCLKPLLLKQIGDYDIEILPMVDTIGIDAHDVAQLVKDAAKDGYFFWDAHEHNVGKLSDGTPIVIDRDALVPLAKMNDEYQPIERTYWRHFLVKAPAMVSHTYTQEKLNKLEQSTNGLSCDYEQKQRDHIESSKLEEGKLSGVFSAADVKSLRKTMQPACKARENSITRIILEGGLNRESFAELSDRATAIAAKGDKSWKEALLECHDKDMASRDRVRSSIS